MRLLAAIIAGILLLWLIRIQQYSLKPDHPKAGWRKLPRCERGRG